MIQLLAFAAYAGALIFWISLLVRGSREKRITPAALLTGVAVGLHFFGLLNFWRTTGELPLVGPGAALSSLAFVGGAALLVMSPMREGARVAIALLPFILLLQGAALMLGIRVSPVVLDYQGIGFVLHVGFAFLGYQGFALAFAAGILYLIQHHELKEKRMGRFFTFLPPLATLDKVGRTGIWIGLLALTLSLLLGWWWTVQNLGSFELTSPKILWALLSWAALLGILGLRHGRGSSEYRSAIATIVGFGIVIASYIALRIASAGSGLFL